MPKNTYVVIQMVYSYLKHQEQKNISYFFTTVNRNLDSEIAIWENLKTQQFASIQLNLAKLLGNQYPKIICAFSQKQNTIARARKRLFQTGWAPLTISHQSTMFGGYRSCGRGNIKFSISHVTSCDHVIRESSEIMGEFPSPWVTILASVVVIGLAEEEIYCF